MCLGMDRDFDFGNIIYLIATIVAVIVGILGKKKKPPVVEDSEDSELMEMEDQELELAPEVFEIQEEAERVSYKGSLMEEYEKLLAEKGMSVEHDMLSEADMATENLELIVLDDEEGGDYFEIIDNFDAAKAVVYSAIINRVDY